MSGTKQICTLAVIGVCSGVSTPSFAVDEFADIDFRGIEVDRVAPRYVPVPATFGHFDWSGAPPEPVLSGDSESSQAFRFKLDVISDSVSEIWEFGPVLQYRIEPDRSLNRLADEIYQAPFPSVAAGAYLGISSGPWEANLTLAAGGLSEGYQGYLTDLEGSYRFSPARDLSLTLGASLSYRDAEHSAAYRGGGWESQSAEGRMTGDGSLTDWGLKLGADYSLNKNLGLFGAVTYDRQASKAPTLHTPRGQRDDSQYGATLSITYQF